MISAILYTSNAGSTAQYAQLLAKETGLPVYALSGAERAVPDGADVIYLGWIMAGSVKGVRPRRQTLSDTRRMRRRYGANGNADRLCPRKDARAGFHSAVYAARQF